MLYIGVDLGTSAVKLLLMDSAGTVQKIVSREYPLSFPQTGWSEQNPLDWYEQTIAGLHQLLEDCDRSQVAGISFGGQMHGLVTLDAEDQVIRPAILWNDGRSTAQTDYLNQTIGKQQLSEYTANIAFAGFTAPKILWMKENEPQNFARICKIMLPKDYLIYRLSGNFATDYSDASGMLLLDVKRRCWSQQMLSICGITEQQLPKLHESYEVVGTLLPQLAEICARNPYGRAVITVCGGSGSGKTGTAALLGYYFKQIGIGSYVLSGDNYPRRYPALNDAERLRIFRQGGMHGLTSGALLNPDVWQQLHTWQIEQRDADPTLCADAPWLAVYQAEGRKALAGYLGTPSEQDFDELGQTLARFKNGIDAIWLKRMGRDDAALWYDKVDFSQVKVLIVEWTHGNSDFYCGVDLPVFLYSTPQETMTYRVSRARDGAADSPFVTMVLQIEQRLLESQAHKAKIILSREGKVLSWSEYCKLAVS